MQDASNDISSLRNLIIQTELKIMSAITELKASIASNAAAIDTAIVLLRQLKTSDDELRQVVSELNTSTRALESVVTGSATVV